jgi:TPR repeat protein
MLEPKIGNTVGAAAAGLRPCGKVIYSPTLRKSDRFQLHDAIAKTLDALGEESCTLEEALEQIFADLKRRDIAVTTMNFAVDQGQADAQFNLGMLYTHGEADWQDDYTQKALWYRKAAEQGDVRAQYNLGYLYRNGKAGQCQVLGWDQERLLARRRLDSSVARSIQRSISIFMTS